MVFSGAATIEEVEFVGGRLCLDFVNTANWLDGRVADERLARSADVRAWMVRQGLVTAGARMAIDVDDFIELRRAVRSLVLRHVGLVEGRGLPELETLRHWRAQPPGEIRLDAEGHRLVGADLASSVLRAIADSAAELLLTSPPHTVNVCGGDRCGWLFLDASPNRRRKWCSMATCGNRQKSRRHHSRRRSGGGSE